MSSAVFPVYFGINYFLCHSSNKKVKNMHEHKCICKEHMNCNKRVRTYCLADVICADIHTLKSFTIAATSTSVDGYTWGFKEGVCSCSKLFSHIHTHFTWHALSFSPFSINTCQVTGNFICYKVTLKPKLSCSKLGFLFKLQNQNMNC